MHVAQNWRLNAQRYALKGVRCEICGKVSFPPREICPHCQVAALNLKAAQEQIQVVVLAAPVALERVLDARLTLQDYGITGYRMLAMHIAQNWRSTAQRYALVGENCPIAGTIPPPRDICGLCR
jgi:uncharacterized OB-fold protein